MSVVKVIIYSMLAAIVAIVFLSLVISKHLKNKKDPNYKPVLSGMEKTISAGCVLIGVLLITAGIFVPKLIKGSDQAGGNQELYSSDDNIENQTVEVVIDDTDEHEVIAFG